MVISTALMVGQIVTLNLPLVIFQSNEVMDKIVNCYGRVPEVSFH